MHRYVKRKFVVSFVGSFSVSDEEARCSCAICCFPVWCRALVLHLPSTTFRFHNNTVSALWFAFFVGLKSFRSAQTIAGLWDIGQEGDSGPERNGRRPGEPILFWPGSTPSSLGLVLTPPANGGQPVPGDDTRSATYSMEDVHQARNT